MPRRKPRGVNGWTRMGGAVPKAEFIPSELPPTKEAIEREMCAGAMRSMEFHGVSIWPTGVLPQKLAEDDFDFEFAAPSGSEYLDLAEVAPLGGVRGGYEGSPTTFPRKRLVNAIMSLVQQKGMHYGLNRRVKVHLLLYTTDFRFLVSDGVVLLAKLALQRNHYRFASVCYYAPIDKEAGVLQVLYPAPGGLPYVSASDEGRMLEGVMTNFDPRQWQADAEKGGFFQQVPPG